MFDVLLIPNKMCVLQNITRMFHLFALVLYIEAENLLWGFFGGFLFLFVCLFTKPVVLLTEIC